MTYNESEINLFRENLRGELLSRLKAGSKRLTWTGIALCILGLLSLIFPAMSSLTIELIIGWLLFFAGLVMLYSSFSYEGAGPFFGSLLSSLLTAGLGVLMIFRPEIGLASLTLVLAGLFIVDGAFKLAMAFELRHFGGWVWLLLSAAASIILGFMIAARFPNSALVTIGILVGINFLITGIMFIMLGRSTKNIVTNA